MAACGGTETVVGGDGITPGTTPTDPVAKPVGGANTLV